MGNFYWVPSKGFRLPSFWNPFSLNKLAASLNTPDLHVFQYESATLARQLLQLNCMIAGHQGQIRAEGFAHQNQLSQ